MAIYDIPTNPPQLDFSSDSVNIALIGMFPRLLGENGIPRGTLIWEFR
jgi:hypothetical protein